MSENQNIRCVAIGDGFVGKTSLLARLTKNEHGERYLATIFDNSCTTVTKDNITYNLHLIDTAGQEDYNYLRTQAYSYADIFLLCYSIDSMASFINIREVWIPEVLKFKENAKCILIGLKTDLFHDPETIDKINLNQEAFISNKDIENLAKKFSFAHVECSAKTKHNLDILMNVIIESGTQKDPVQHVGICMNNPCTSIFRTIFCFNRNSYGT